MGYGNSRDSRAAGCTNTILLWVLIAVLAVGVVLYFAGAR